MKKYVVLIIAALLAITGSAAYAENNPGEAGMTSGLSGEVTTIKCSVEEVKFYSPSWSPVGSAFRGMYYQMALKISSSSDMEVALLGPAMYIDSQDMKIGRYDSLEITGFRDVSGGKPVLIAQEVRKGGHVLKLRDSDGRPLWAGAKARAASY